MCRLESIYGLWVCVAEDFYEEGNPKCSVTNQQVWVELQKQLQGRPFDVAVM